MTITVIKGKKQKKTKQRIGTHRYGYTLDSAVAFRYVALLIIKFITSFITVGTSDLNDMHVVKRSKEYKHIAIRRQGTYLLGPQSP